MWDPSPGDWPAARDRHTSSTSGGREFWSMSRENDFYALLLHPPTPRLPSIAVQRINHLIASPTWLRTFSQVSHIPLPVGISDMGRREKLSRLLLPPGRNPASNSEAGGHDMKGQGTEGDDAPSLLAPFSSVNRITHTSHLRKTQSSSNTADICD